MRQFHAPGRVNLIGDPSTTWDRPADGHRPGNGSVGATRADRRIVAVSDNFSDLGEGRRRHGRGAVPDGMGVGQLPVGVAYAFRTRGGTTRGGRSGSRQHSQRGGAVLIRLTSNWRWRSRSTLWSVPVPLPPNSP